MGQTFVVFNNKLMRKSTHPSRMGVLNMTIDFAGNHRYSPRHNTVSPIRPRAVSLTTRQIASHPLQKTSPYLRYRLSHRQSVRPSFQQKNTIIGLSPSLQGRTIQLQAQQIGEITQFDEREIKSRSSVRDAQLRMVFNKKHLKNQEGDDRKVNRLSINLRNPEEDLRDIFTVRPAKTSERIRARDLAKDSKKKTHNKPPLVMRRNPLAVTLSGEDSQVMKRIRPWSTSRNQQNKVTSIQVVM